MTTEETYLIIQNGLNELLKQENAFREDSKQNMTFLEPCKIVQQGDYEVRGAITTILSDSNGSFICIHKGKRDWKINLQELLAVIYLNNNEELGKNEKVKAICGRKDCCRLSHLCIDRRAGARIPESDRARIFERCETGGESQASIAREYGVSHNAINKIIKALREKPPQKRIPGSDPDG